jgi:hypothetical protein
MVLFGGTSGQGRDRYQVNLEDERPVGSLLFADPGMAQMPQRINQFNEPNDHAAVGRQCGVASITGVRVPWKDRQINTVGEEILAARNRKRYTAGNDVRRSCDVEIEIDVEDE